MDFVLIVGLLLVLGVSLGGVAAAKHITKRVGWWRERRAYKRVAIAVSEQSDDAEWQAEQLVHFTRTK